MQSIHTAFGSETLPNNSSLFESRILQNFTNTRSAASMLKQVADPSDFPLPAARQWGSRAAQGRAKFKLRVCRVVRKRAVPGKK